jgi:hypothetical protein
MKRIVGLIVVGVLGFVLTSCAPISYFKGFWYHHSVGVTIDAAGNGVVSYRTYRWCGPGVPQPCDTMSGNSILNGGHATFRLTTPLASHTGLGYITSANELPRGQRVTITTVRIKNGWPIVTAIGGVFSYPGVLFYCNPPTPADYDARCGA